MSFVLLLLPPHLVEMVALLSGQPVVQVFELGLEVLLLGGEGSVPSGELRSVPLAKVVNLSPVAIFLSSKLVAVPLVEASVLVCTSPELLVSAPLILGKLFVPLILTLDGPVPKVGNLLILAIDLSVVPLVLIVELLQMSLLGQGGLPLLLLDIVHELLDLGLKTVLELLLHLCVFLDLLGGVGQDSLQLLSCCLALTNELLVLSDVILQVVEHLELLVKGNQCVQLVFKLDFLFFES